MQQKSIQSFFGKKSAAPSNPSLGPMAKDLQKARTITDIENKATQGTSVKKRKLRAVNDSDSEFGPKDGKAESEYDMSELADAMVDSDSGDESLLVKPNTAKKRKTAPSGANPKKSAAFPSEPQQIPSTAVKAKGAPSKSNDLQISAVKSEAIVDCEDQKIGGGFTSQDDIKDALPDFLKYENRTDGDGLRPGEDGYDETSLKIPDAAWKGFTPCMTQYWGIKQHNLEKILFFKLGKFYEIFHEDAIVCQKALDLNWMGGAKKLHVGFPEKALDKYLSIMVNLGCKVAVIEQTETPRELAERNAEHKKQGIKKEQCVRRAISEMVTRGTFQPSDQGYEPRYILAYKKQQSLIGVTFFDVTTSKLHIGEFQEEDECQMQKFRTLICQIRPVEIIQERESANSSVAKMLKNSPVVPTFTTLPPAKCYSGARTLQKLGELFKNAPSWPQSLLDLRESGQELALQTLGMAVAFLEEALIAEKTIPTGIFYRYSPEAENANNQLEYMVLDSQCLQHLEIIESASGQKEGSLYDFLDHCRTPFGKRQLKRWLMAPLLNISQITDRQNAVQDLMNCDFETGATRVRMGKLPDLEKLLARIFTYSVKHRVKAIYFEDVSLIKMREFRTLLKTFRRTEEILGGLMARKDQFTSQKLRRLLTLDSESEDGLFPSQYLEVLQSFEAVIVWKRVPGGKDEIPEPQHGLDAGVDEANQAVNDVKAEREAHLVSTRGRFAADKRKINFSHAKFRFELEIPAELVKGNRKPADFEFTSQRAGFERFHTKEIKGMVDRLEKAEEQLKDAMIPFLCAIFSRFHESKDIWTKLLSILTEVDCLASLAVTSGHSELPMVRPELVPYEGEYANKALFDIKQMVHPCVQLTGGKSFIPNDTYIEPGEPGQQAGQGLLLVTGPNMGGKSTILRQNCLAAIMAQIGCFVPCHSFRLTPIDRIFTRLGASDRILEGKSTFFVEMEETKNVIQLATHRSLAILDELGRGTSTFDGYSIAHAVLNYLVNKLKCRAMFSTHYHMLLDDFKNKPGVATFHMSYVANEEKDNITFLYKFVKGECPMSFGINVARMAGIPKSILERAKCKSSEFSANLEKIAERVKEKRQNQIMSNV